MLKNYKFLEFIQEFAESVRDKSSSIFQGEPEEQLRAPTELLLSQLAKEKNLKLNAVGEISLPDRLGKPDYAIFIADLLVGYIELKAPGKGAEPRRYKGHDKKQWNRFKILPNLLYTDGNEWGLYRYGKRDVQFPIVRFSGDILSDGQAAITENESKALELLLLEFIDWEPIIPPKINAKRLAELIAPLCGYLRDDVTETLRYQTSSLNILAKDWRDLLFPEASNEQFADAYAQTVTFALLLARSEGASTIDLTEAIHKLEGTHSLLSKALTILTDETVIDEIATSLRILQRLINSIPPKLMEVKKEDPWLYFYEDFLAEYDPKLRKDAGVYFTPIEVVNAQVKLIDEILIKKLGKRLGFADTKVMTLDPAVGTGTYLLRIINLVISRIKLEEGDGAIPGRLSHLAKRIFGFENLVGPYSVAELRISRTFRENGGTLPAGGPNIFLTDTLESPYAKPLDLGLYLKPLADQHKKAIEVKQKVPVIVCIGNPPYDRHKSVTEADSERKGGWVRWADPKEGEEPILQDFIKPVKEEGRGGELKNMYNLYVYFWRWAIWKVFEQENVGGPGIVSFITASSYLDGDAFLGMREHLRKLCNDIWIIDLGGKIGGTRKSENVFNIRTPVAIAIALRKEDKDPKIPAFVHYTRIRGSRQNKLDVLMKVHSSTDLIWEKGV